MATDRQIKHLCVCAAACGAILATGVALAPAWAGKRDFVVTGEVVPTRTVQINDLNLVSAQGQLVLQRRIRGAVHWLCDSPGRMPLQEEMERRQCSTAAFESARPQVEAAIRNARYAGRQIPTIVLAGR